MHTILKLLNSGVVAPTSECPFWSHLWCTSWICFRAGTLVVACLFALAKRAQNPDFLQTRNSHFLDPSTMIYNWVGQNLSTCLKAAICRKIWGVPEGESFRQAPRRREGLPCWLSFGVSLFCGDNFEVRLHNWTLLFKTSRLAETARSGQKLKELDRKWNEGTESAA